MSNHPAERQPPERSWTRRFPSSLESYHPFIAEVLAQLEAHGWTKGDLFGVEMALEESISNAIRHGNKLDPDKHVDVECRVEPQRFWIRVEDQGAGFCPDDVPDCCSPECLELPGGRGLALMKAYMSKVQYNERGNCLVLEKKLDERPQRPAAAS
jgi:serine/threonine-protein kinase RsbW